MTPKDFQNDPHLRTLAGLPAFEPDRQCADRIRGHCHSLLAKRRCAEARQVPAGNRFYRRIVEPALVAGASAVYLSEVLRRAAALYGF